MRRLYEEMKEENKRRMQQMEEEQERGKTSEAIPDQPWKGKFNLVNLNEDPFLTRKIHHILKEGNNNVGKNDPNKPPHIILGGAGILKNHCVIKLHTSIAEIIPTNDSNPGKVFVNGQLVTQPTVLMHNDRILFGAHNFFVFNDPSQIEDTSVDFNYARDEATKSDVLAITAEQDAILKAKLKEIEEKIDEDRKKAEEKAKTEMEIQLKSMEEKRSTLERQYVNKLKALRAAGGDEAEVRKLKQEMEKMNSNHTKNIKEIEQGMNRKTDEAKRKERLMREQTEFRIRNQKELEERLADIIPKINEVNEMCVQLNRFHYLYTPTIVTEMYGKQIKSNIYIKIYPDHRKQNIYNQVDVGEFIDKLYYSIQDKFERKQYDLEHEEFNEADENNEEDFNIFGVSITNDWKFIGQALIYTDVLGNLLETINDQTPIIDNTGITNGNS